MNTDIIEIETTEEQVSDEEWVVRHLFPFQLHGSYHLQAASASAFASDKYQDTRASIDRARHWLVTITRTYQSTYQIIAHNVRVQSLMDAHGLAWAVQWEIARGISNGWWRWEDVTPGRLHELPGGS